LPLAAIESRNGVRTRMKKRNIVPKKIKDTKSRIRHCCLVGCFVDDVGIVFLWGSFEILVVEGFVSWELGADEDGDQIICTTAKASGTNLVNTVSIPVSTASANEGLSLSVTTNSQEDDYEIPPLEDIHEDTTDGIFTHSSYDDEGAEADFTNLETVVNVSPIPTSRINPSHPSTLILGDPTSAVQTRSKVNKSSKAHAFASYVQKQRRINHKDFHHCLFACFLSQHEPKKISEALEDESWVDAMQEEPKIYIDNESTICIVKNPVYHSKTKHTLPQATFHHGKSNLFQETPKTLHITFLPIKIQSSSSMQILTVPTSGLYMNRNKKIAQ
ncbi:hypothetical protein Tco_0942640, partial [Tanacetum coccineum]